jgi:hypothetical protein
LDFASPTLLLIGRRRSADRAQLGQLRCELSLKFRRLFGFIVEGFSPLQDAALWKPIGDAGEYQTGWIVYPKGRPS